MSDFTSTCEKYGQRAMVDAGCLPIKIRTEAYDDRYPKEWATRFYVREDEAVLIYEALGITAHRPAADSYFFHVTLPRGWKIVPQPDHLLWSYVNDDKGKARIRVFYKCTVHDTRAHATVIPTAMQTLLHRLQQDGCTSAHWSTTHGVETALNSLASGDLGKPVPSPRYENGQLLDMTEELAEEALRILDSPTLSDPEVLGKYSL